MDEDSLKKRPDTDFFMFRVKNVLFLTSPARTFLIWR